MPRRGDRHAFQGPLLRDLIAQLFSDRARIDAGRYCAYNGFLGLVLLGGALALRLSGSLERLGVPGFALAIASAIVLLAAFIIPPTRPRRVPAMLALQGLIIIALTIGFSLACAAWALGTPETRAFRYLPGPVTVGMTYGAALWADFGPAHAHPRHWRMLGCIVGLVLEVATGALVLRVLLRT